MIILKTAEHSIMIHLFPLQILDSVVCSGGTHNPVASRKKDKLSLDF